jgi:hypothetical protein
MANNEGAAPDSENNQAQTLIERASQQFDFFAMQLPLVIKARIEAFMKKGFRAVLIEDPEAAPAEEKWFNHLLMACGVSVALLKMTGPPIKENEKAMVDKRLSAK